MLKNRRRCRGQMRGFASVYGEDRELRSGNGSTPPKGGGADASPVCRLAMEKALIVTCRVIITFAVQQWTHIRAHNNVYE
jgi:hypothetical protein